MPRMKTQSGAQDKPRRAPGTSTGLVLCYVTCPDLRVATALGQAMLTERLAACVNCLPGMRSRYWWRGRIERAREVVLIAKTRSSKVASLIGRIRELHPSSVPCVLVLPVVDGNPDYLAWLRAETASGGRPLAP